MFYVEKSKYGKTTEHINVKPLKSKFESLSTEEHEKRNIFTAHLKDLEQDTTYAFSISLNPRLFGSEAYYFKTFNPESMTIVNGGDVGINYESREMNQNGLSNIEPDLIMIGGDISYDNNFPECYRATDQLLLEIPHSKPDSDSVIENEKGYNFVRLIPMIKSTGNHDLGVNSVNNVHIAHNKHEPLFKHYYPQNTFNNQIPDIYHRKEYFYHIIGNQTLILTLDSAYNSDVDGDQKEWMMGIFEKFKHIPIKIVHYHEPIYPS